jgi:ABC-type multidrug transport system ATPase subunit
MSSKSSGLVCHPKACKSESYSPIVAGLSVGQKCTAMLVIALTVGVVPIVIDQPEDSLDIRSIWEDMCSKIRRGKEWRQFIFTTHSSSLAVASDTDKFLIMEATSTHGKVLILWVHGSFSNQ